MKAKAVQFDFSKVHEPAKWAAFRTELEHLDVGVLGRYHAFVPFAVYLTHLS